MKITLDDLKRAYKSHIQRCVPPSRQECPSAENIFALFDDSVSPSNKEKIIEHITNCCYCLQEFELHLDFYRKREQATGKIDACCLAREGNSRTPGKRFLTSDALSSLRIRPRASWKLAVISLMAISIVIVTLIGIRSILKIQETGERGRRLGQIRLIFPVRGEKASIPLIFQWEPDPRAEYYRLEIFDKSLRSLWKSPRVVGVRYELPPEAADIVKGGEPHFWMVTARLMDGREQESDLEEFTVKD